MSNLVDKAKHVLGMRIGMELMFDEVLPPREDSSGDIVFPVLQTDGSKADVRLNPMEMETTYSQGVGHFVDYVLSKAYEVRIK